MLSRNRSSVLAVGAALAAVPAVAVAASDDSPEVRAASHAPIAGVEVAQRLPAEGPTHAQRAKRKLVLENAALAKALKKTRGNAFRRAAHVDRVKEWSGGRLRARNAHFERKLERLRAEKAAPGRGAATAAGTQAGGGASQGGSSSAAGGQLAAIAACESGGDASAVGGGGQFRGKYQFMQSTWESVGGTGDPASASDAEQDKRAAMLLQREGAGHWPVCGK